MKLPAFAACAGILMATLLILATTAAAQGVGVNVEPIDELEFNVPGTFTIATATAGAQPDSVVQTSNWEFTTNGNTSRSVTASLTSAPPPGMTIEIDMGPPTDTDGPTSGSAGTATVGTFSNLSFTNITLWTGAQRQVVEGTATWEAKATVEVDPEQDYSATITFTFAAQ